MQQLFTFFQKIKFSKVFSSVSLSALILIIVIELSISFLRMGYRVSINYNEGWNVYHTEDIMQGKNLYGTFLTPVNYPPLSFLVIGVMSQFTKNPLVTGRFIAFVSLLVIAWSVAKCTSDFGGNRYESFFSGVICLSFFLILAPSYIGMDDPQLLANACLMTGLLFYNKQLSKKNLIITALLFSIGLFVKHNIIALPLAFTLHLFLYNRKSFFLWIAYFLGSLFAMTVITQFISKGNFISSLLLERDYNTLNITHAVVPALLVLTLPLILCSIFVIVIRTDKKIFFLLCYLILSIVFGIVFSGGSGTFINMFFDTIISLSLVLGIILIKLRKSESMVKQKLYNVVKYYILLYVIILLVSVFSGFYTTNFIHKQVEMTQDIAFLERYNGAAFCDDLLLCYFAGKPFLYDPFLVNEMIISGKIKEKVAFSQVTSGSFAVVELSTRTIFLQRQYNITKHFHNALVHRYYQVRKTENKEFYIRNK